jgi:hypothetical protein
VRRLHKRRNSQRLSPTSQKPAFRFALERASTMRGGKALDTPKGLSNCTPYSYEAALGLTHVNSSVVGTIFAGSSAISSSTPEAGKTQPSGLRLRGSLVDSAIHDWRDHAERTQNLYCARR